MVYFQPGEWMRMMHYSRKRHRHTRKSEDCPDHFDWSQLCYIHLHNFLKDELCKLKHCHPWTVGLCPQNARELITGRNWTISEISWWSLAQVEEPVFVIETLYGLLWISRWDRWIICFVFVFLWAGAGGGEWVEGGIDISLGIPDINPVIVEKNGPRGFLSSLFQHNWAAKTSDNEPWNEWKKKTNLCWLSHQISSSNIYRRLDQDLTLRLWLEDILCQWPRILTTNRLVVSNHESEA